MFTKVLVVFSLYFMFFEYFLLFSAFDFFVFFCYLYQCLISTTCLSYLFLMVALGQELSVGGLQTHSFICDLLWGIGCSYLYNNIRMLFAFFYSVDICSDDTETVVGKLLAPQHQSGPGHQPTGGHCVLHCLEHTFLNILNVKIVNVQKAVLLCTPESLSPTGRNMNYFQPCESSGFFWHTAFSCFFPSVVKFYQCVHVSLVTQRVHWTSLYISELRATHSSLIFSPAYLVLPCCQTLTVVPSTR